MYTNNFRSRVAHKEGHNCKDLQEGMRNLKRTKKKDEMTKTQKISIDLVLTEIVCEGGDRGWDSAER